MDEQKHDRKVECLAFWDNSNIVAKFSQLTFAGERNKYEKKTQKFKRNRSTRQSGEGQSEDLYATEGTCRRSMSGLSDAQWFSVGRQQKLPQSGEETYEFYWSHSGVYWSVGRKGWWVEQAAMTDVCEELIRNIYIFFLKKSQDRNKLHGKEIFS